jgi:thiol-disulfide isomerase/thioredoxin
MNVRNVLILFIGIFIIALFAAYSYLFLYDSEAAAPSQSGKYFNNISEVTSVQFPDAQTPQFSWTDQKGKKVSFAEFSKGNVVLINFWATWCGPCRRELPDLIALSRDYAPKKVKVIGISVDSGTDVLTMVHKFCTANNITYPIIIDNGELEKAFGGIQGIPTTFFVNKNGKIAQKMVGLQSKETFSSVLDALVKD